MSEGKWLALLMLGLIVFASIIGAIFGEDPERAERDAVRKTFHSLVIPMMVSCLDVAATEYVARTGDAPFLITDIEEQLGETYLPGCARGSGVPSGFECDWLACRTTLNNGEDLSEVWAGDFIAWSEEDPRYNYDQR